MLKTTATPNSASKPKTDYPCLKVSENGRIVLFTAPARGVCLCGSDSYVGNWSDAWAEEMCFKPFRGIVTIEAL